MNQLFNNKQRMGAAGVETKLDQLVGSIQQNLNDAGHSFVTKSVAKSAISMESMSSVVAMELDTSIKSLNVALESICTEHGMKGMTVAQRQAAIVAGVISSDIPGFLAAPIKHNVISTESYVAIPANGGDFMSDRMKVALEAYDEKENKNAVVYSVAYNMQAARQDEFGETFYPTVVVTPDQVGFTVSIRLISVYDEVRRNFSGAKDNFNKRNIIHAVIDHTILRNDQTKITPVYRDESASKFIAASLMAPRMVVVEEQTINTSALKMGTTLSLLGISQTEALLETGMQDSTDSIDTAVTLSALYVKIGAVGSEEILKFNTARLPMATFTYAIQGNYRMMNLTFNNESLKVSKDTKKVDGAASTVLASLVAGQYVVRLGVQVSGSVNLELADTNLYAAPVVVARVSDVDGNQLSLTSGAGLTIANLFAGASVEGYDLDARRTNLNRRQRGQLLDTTFYNQVYAVPLRSAITIPRPLTIGDANDSSDLAALITATHIRTSNAAVGELLKVEQILKDYVNSKDGLSDTPEILGVARFLVQPFYEHQDLNMLVQVDSVKSAERAADIQAVLVNALRDLSYRMYRDSGYKAAADALAGGISSVPTVIIGTDPVLSRYLTVTGDLRTLANEFNVKIVSTLDNRMAGKIVLSFGDFTSGKEGVPNPMHFGNMAWKPELTLVLPLHRNGANSKELTVQPSFIHITNLPIMASITVTGIRDVVAAKVPVNFHSV